MVWNLRIIKHKSKGGDYYGIYEVFYINGKPNMHTDQPVDVGGEDVDELLEYYIMLEEAFCAPILTEDDFPA